MTFIDDEKEYTVQLNELPYTSPFTVTKKFTRHWGKKFAF